MAVWTWLQSDESLLIRIAIGVTIFVILAIVDFRRHGKHATRWREYAFLMLCVVTAIIYGIVNDLITSRISVEYFIWGKGVFDRVGDEIAADPEAHRTRLDLEAVRIGTLATWSVGLIAGALMLITNSVGKRPPLRMAALVKLLPLIFAGAICFGVMGGFAGGCGWLIWMSSDFPTMVARDEWRPYRFMAVFGIHLGGYIGAGMGLMAAIVQITRLRRRCPQSAV